MGLGKGLSAALAAMYLLAHPAAAQTPPPAKLPFVLKEIGPGVYAAISGSNAGVVIGDDAVLVVDSFFEPDTAKALLSEIRKITPKPIRYVVNTHYHLDHVAGDQVFKAMPGAIIVAHRNVRAWIRPENFTYVWQMDPIRWRSGLRNCAPARFWSPKARSPFGFGARRVDVRPVEGHTGGDLVVSVPDAKALFCGDPHLLWRMPPNIVDGAVSKWIATDRSFEDLPEAASMVFVPGHGDVATVKDVAIFRSYLTDLLSLTEAGRKNGLKGDALAADVVPKLHASHADYFTPHAEVMLMERELDGTKRVPQPVP